jgi:acetyl esterase/lipase
MKILKRYKMKKFKRMLFAVAIWMLCLITGVKGQIVPEVLLYPNNPEFKPENREEKIEYDADGVRNVIGKVVPRLLVYKPEKASGAGVIMCPGGAKNHVRTCRQFAEKLTPLGVTVFALVSRLPAYEKEASYMDAALQDVQAAFRLVRSRAGEWGLDKNMIGIWGNSYGGFLAAMAATHYTIPYVAGSDTAEVRPDFLVLAWAGRSCPRFREETDPAKKIFGGEPTEERIHYYSPNEWINSKTPATFILSAHDDPIGDPASAVCFYETLRKSGVPAELHIYEKGGHGLDKIDPDVFDTLMNQFVFWLRNR